MDYLNIKNTCILGDGYNYMSYYFIIITIIYRSHAIATPSRSRSQKLKSHRKMYIPIKNNIFSIENVIILVVLFLFVYRHEIDKRPINIAIYIHLVE